MVDEDKLKQAHAQITRLRSEISKQIVGQDDLVKNILAALFASGHVLLEGVPGLGKTLLVKTLGNALDLDFSRVQFTPDLMPADIVGTQLVAHDEEGKRHFEFQTGPVFTQLLLADEINRATPKTQSALLEAMEEKQVTAGNIAYALQSPFMVLATQNPIEMEGTYPLPEAQLDRFMVKLVTVFPSADELSQILDRTTGTLVPAIEKVMSVEDVEALRQQVRGTVIAEHVKQFAVRLVMSTHPGSAHASPMTQQYVRYGASPRGAQSMVLMAKVFALFDGRLNVSFDDLKQAAEPCLRHRILLNFEGEAEGVDSQQVIQELVETTPATTADQ